MTAGWLLIASSFRRTQLFGFLNLQTSLSYPPSHTIPLRPRDWIAFRATTYGFTVTELNPTLAIVDLLAAEDATTPLTAPAESAPADGAATVNTSTAKSSDRIQDDTCTSCRGWGTAQALAATPVPPSSAGVHSRLSRPVLPRSSCPA